MKNTLRVLSATLAALILSFGLVGCGGASLSPKVQDAFNNKREMYTQRNMFISKYDRYGQKFVETTNYGNGVMIPVNTKVRFKDVNSKQMSFTYKGNLVMLRNIPKYSGTNVEEMINRYFGPKKVNLSKFTRLEKDAILSKKETTIPGGVHVSPFGVHKSGPVTSLSASKIVVGMSKEAVLVSRGYPPVHATSSLKSDKWKYWETKFNTRIVEFKNDKVSNIIE